MTPREQAVDFTPAGMAVASLASLIARLVSLRGNAIADDWGRHLREQVDDAVREPMRDPETIAVARYAMERLGLVAIDRAVADRYARAVRGAEGRGEAVAQACAHESKPIADAVLAQLGAKP